MPHVLDTLKERGFLAQITFEEDLYKLLSNEQVTFYAGFDPTADSLHVGHYIPVMAMAHLQRAGHRPIALIGGGTSMVGDPSGRTDLRQMLTPEEIRRNSEGLRRQFASVVDFSGDRALMVDNADWLLPLNYMAFLREIGASFSVNRMLTAECYRQRMEKGLTFLEFNYMIMQAYDFLELHRRYGCKLEIGGDDQWSNILAGADLIRRKEQKDAFAMTMQLLLKADGTKMGKTAKGALWLDREKCPVFDFYQYFRNVDDADVRRFMCMLTFLPMQEIDRLMAGDINQAKAALAREVTAVHHGMQEARAAEAMALSLFAGGGESAPEVSLPAGEALSDPRVARLLMLCGLTKSIGEARRAIEQGGVTMNGRAVSEADARAEPVDFEGGLLLRKGKKAYMRIRLS